MGNFFSLDGPLTKYGNLLADFTLLSLLWVVFSIPLVTIGAATTALFYVATRRISDIEGHLFRDFWSSFLLNFRQSTICWLIVLLILQILFINIINIGILGSLSNIGLLIQLCIALEIYIISIYVFPIIARFKLSLWYVLKNAFFIANRHFLTTLTLLVVGAGVILLSLLTVLFTFVAMGVYAFIASHLLMRVFRRYLPNMDRDEELE